MADAGLPHKLDMVNEQTFEGKLKPVPKNVGKFDSVDPFRGIHLPGCSGRGGGQRPSPPFPLYGSRTCHAALAQPPPPDPAPRSPK